MYFLIFQIIPFNFFSNFVVLNFENSLTFQIEKFQIWLFFKSVNYSNLENGEFFTLEVLKIFELDIFGI